ncbi:MAG: phospholipid carrier-dependent glycosyltransferase [Candidatus Moranbacteria bacterium]|nr:phospholipid carrier-dependent glycosyltransferase [Candidatus Moranbacteria bacterium]
MKKINKTIHKHANKIAFFFLGFMFLVMVGSMYNDTAIRDEMPHIVAGYSYLTQFDYRLNPEHPPLVKQLSAFPLLFMDINFPDQDPAWKNEVNDQWELGNTFLYKSGNDADKMIFWGRIPIVILTLLAAWIIFLWTARIFSSKIAGLLSMALFVFSPNIIAHGRFITTDMGVAAFSVFALYSWWSFLKNPNKKNFIIAALLQAALHLAKFSSPLFMPVLLLMTIFSIIFDKKDWNLKKRIKIFLGGFVFATLIAGLIIGAWYQIFMFKMPLEVQQDLIQASIADDHFNNAGLATKLTELSRISFLRPFVQYMLGFFMVAAHASYGHTTYFLGEVGQNWPHYYFVAYLLKEPIASQIILYLAIILSIASIVKFLKLNKNNSKRKGLILEFLKKYNILVAFACLIGGFFFIGMRAKLQLGIRYIVPIFPYLYILISAITVLGVKYLFKEQLKQKTKKFFIVAFFVFLFFWLFVINILTFPAYLAYFNEYIGGSAQGWRYMIDSNLDWGQDLKRLKFFMKENNIKSIKVDYFGGGDLDYYLGKDNYTLWGYDKGPTKGWIAISVNAIQWNSANKGDKMSYHWLTDNYEPVKKIGNSIFVYHIKE